MSMRKPNHLETVWIEYPEGRHLLATYDAESDSYRTNGSAPIAANAIANWSYEEHEDTDISDQPLAEKGKLTRS